MYRTMFIAISTVLQWTSRNQHRSEATDRLRDRSEVGSMQNLGVILLACGLLTAIGRRDHTRGFTFLASILVFVAGLLIVLAAS